MCACPYSFRCLGFSSEVERGLEQLLIKESCLLFKPGFTRLSAHLAISDEQLDMLAEAVEFVADHGVSLLSKYSADPRTAEWTVRGSKKLDMFKESKWLGDLPLNSHAFHRQKRVLNTPHQPLLGKALFEANRQLLNTCGPAQQTEGSPKEISDEAEKLRWFLLAEDLEWSPQENGFHCATIRGSNHTSLTSSPSMLS